MKTNRFQDNVSTKLFDNFNLNEGLNTVGNTLSSIFGKQPIENTTIIQPEAPNESQEDNTLLYLGLGGGALLLVILLIVFLR